MSELKVNKEESAALEPELHLSETEWDEVGDISTIHLSFLIMMGLPKRFFNSEEIVDRVRETETALSNAAGIDNDVVRNKVFGCFAQGFNIPDAVKLTKPPKIVNFDRAVDVLVEIKKLKVSDTATGQGDRLFAKFDENDEIHSGYTRLCMENAQLSPTLSDGHESVIFDEGAGKYYVSSKFHRESIPGVNSTPVKETEPGEQQYTYKHVVALPCVSWPKCAEDWISRPRNGKWLSRLLAESIASQGCHVIPEPHVKSANPDVEWKLLFSKAENTIARETVTVDQRRCFVFFLVLMNQIDNGKFFLRFQHYHAVFLHVCEKLPLNVWKNNPGYCLLYMLDYLLTCIREKCIAHYFIPENNLIDAVPSDEVTEMAEKLETFRKNPLSVYLDFCDSHVFGFQCSHTPFRQIMKPVLDDMTSFSTHRNIVTSVETVFSQTLFQVAHLLIEENTDKKIFEAVNYLLELFPLFQNYESALTSESVFLDLLGQQLDTVSKAKRFYEEALRRSSAYPDLKKVRGNLACLYHATAYEFELGSDDRRELLCKSEALFRDYIKSKEAETACSIDYVNLLFKQMRYKDVISICTKFIEDNLVDRGVQNAYSHLELKAVDDNFKREICSNGFICAPSTVFAHYFLLQSCSKVDEPAQNMTKLFSDFEGLCARVSDATCFALLGYCYKDLSRWPDAVRCFQAADKCNDGHALATELVKECEQKK